MFELVVEISDLSRFWIFYLKTMPNNIYEALLFNGKMFHLRFDNRFGRMICVNMLKIAIDCQNLFVKICKNIKNKYSCLSSSFLKTI